MASLNRVFLLGNLTGEPTTVQTNSGGTIAKFGMAINRKWTGKDGQKHDEATFVSVSCFDQLANNVSTYLHKGSPVFIEGRLKLDQWTDKNTQQKRSQLSVVAENVQFLESGRGQQAERPAAAPAVQSSPEEFGSTAEPPKDGIPF